MLISAGFDGSICHWTLSKYKDGLVNAQLENQIENAHDNSEPEISAMVALCHDVGFVTAGNDCSLKMWNLEDQDAYASVSNLEEAVNCMALDGFFLFTGTHKGHIQMWDFSMAQEEGALSPLARWRGHAGSVRGLALVPRCGHLATAAADGAVRVWDYQSSTFTEDLNFRPEEENECEDEENKESDKKQGAGNHEGGGNSGANLLKEFQRTDKSFNCIACQVRSNRSVVSILIGCQDGEILRFLLPLEEDKPTPGSQQEEEGGPVVARPRSPAEEHNRRQNQISEVSKKEEQANNMMKSLIARKKQFQRS